MRVRTVIALSFAAVALLTTSACKSEAVDEQTSEMEVSATGCLDALERCDLAMSSRDANEIATAAAAASEYVRVFSSTDEAKALPEFTAAAKRANEAFSKAAKRRAPDAAASEESYRTLLEEWAEGDRMSAAPQYVDLTGFDSEARDLVEDGRLALSEARDALIAAGVLSADSTLAGESTGMNPEVDEGAEDAIVARNLDRTDVAVDASGYRSETWLYGFEQEAMNEGSQLASDAAERAELSGNARFQVAYRTSAHLAVVLYDSADDRLALSVYQAESGIWMYAATWAASTDEFTLAAVEQWASANPDLPVDLLRKAFIGRMNNM